MRNQIQKTHKKIELLVSGSFTSQELKELENKVLFKKFSVHRYLVKTFETEEVIRLFFRDLDAYTLLRDGILFEILKLGVSRSWNWVKSKKPKAKISAGVELHFKKKDGIIPVNVPLPLGNKRRWRSLEKTLTTKFIDSCKKGEMVNLTWDISNDKVKVRKMKI